MGFLHFHVLFLGCLILRLWVLLWSSKLIKFLFMLLFFLKSNIFPSVKTDDVCKEVNCGKGTCKPSSSAFFFECECQPGWKQTASGSGDDFKFLPCVIPNCKAFFLPFLSYYDGH